MGDESMALVRVFIDKHGLPTCFGLNEEEAAAPCGLQEQSPPQGMQTVDAFTSIEAFESKYGYEHVCGSIFRVKLPSPASSTQKADFLETSVDTFLQHLLRGIGILLKGPPKLGEV